MVYTIHSYRAEAKILESSVTPDESTLEFDLSEVDYITSDGFAAIIRFIQRGKTVRLLNANDHIRDTIELIKLEDVL